MSLLITFKRGVPALFVIFTLSVQAGEYTVRWTQEGVESSTSTPEVVDPSGETWSAFAADYNRNTPINWSDGINWDGFTPGASLACLPMGGGDCAAYANPYPASVITGNLWLDGNNFSNVEGLASIAVIDGELLLHADNLEGLRNLTSVGGSVNLGAPNWTMLDHVEGLRNLTSVGGSLSVSAYNIYGLRNLTTVGKNLLLSQTPISSINGLASLTSVGEDLAVDGLTITNVDGLGNLTNIGRNLRLDQNPNLVDLSGLSNLQSFGGWSAQFDSGIHLRPGFVPIQGGALCDSANASKFSWGNALQPEVCLTVN